jgi:hypothetical protein
MSSTTGPERAARGFLARLVAVVAVLAGVVLVQGLQCAGGMSGMHVASGMTCSHPVAMDSVDGHFTQETVTSAEADQLPTSGCAVASGATDSHLDSDGLGGVLAACLAYLVAVVAAMTGLRPIMLRCVDRLRFVHAPTIRRVLSRAPSLAELCLLRT